MEKVIERVKAILMGPKDALISVKTEEVNVTDFMKRYVAIVAAVPAIAQFIGLALVGHPVFGRHNFFATLFFAAIFYALSLVGVFVFGKIINALADNFNSTKNDQNAFKLAVYAFTPGFVAGVFYIVPGLRVLTMLGSLYGIYILYIGLPVLMETPDDKNTAYTIVTLIVGLIVMIVIGAIATVIALGSSVPAVYF